MGNDTYPYVIDKHLGFSYGKLARELRRRIPGELAGDFDKLMAGMTDTLAETRRRHDILHSLAGTHVGEMELQHALRKPQR